MTFNSSGNSGCTIRQLGYACMAAALAMSVECPVHAAEWKPERPVELIIGAAAGGNLDITARAIQAICERRDPGDVSSIEDPSALDQVRQALAG